MHWGWWIFWILVIIAVVWLFTQNRARDIGPAAGGRESPLEVLQRRYAAGKISTEEYEERKAHLEEEI